MSNDVPISFPLQYTYKTIRVADSEDENLLDHFDQTNRFIETARQTGRILVHCMAGVSRSATVVIAYLIWKNSWTVS